MELLGRALQYITFMEPEEMEEEIFPIIFVNNAMDRTRAIFFMSFPPFLCYYFTVFFDKNQWK